MAPRACFQHAFDVAAEVSAKTLQLRAALGLCRLQRERGIELLRSTYETFTEGFETSDLIDAKELLSRPPAPPSD